MIAMSETEVVMGAQRKTLKEQIIEAEQEKENAAKRVLELKKEAKSVARKIDTRRKCVIGGAVQEHASRDRDFRAALERVLRLSVRERDRAVLPDFFPECSSGQVAPDRSSDAVDASLSRANP